MRAYKPLAWSLAREPICTLRTTITNQDGAIVLDGNALVYRETLAAEPD